MSQIRIPGGILRCRCARASFSLDQTWLLVIWGLQGVPEFLDSGFLHLINEGWAFCKRRAGWFSNIHVLIKENVYGHTAGFKAGMGSPSFWQEPFGCFKHHSGALQNFPRLACHALIDFKYGLWLPGQGQTKWFCWPYAASWPIVSHPCFRRSEAQSAIHTHWEGLSCRRQGWIPAGGDEDWHSCCGSSVAVPQRWNNPVAQSRSPVETSE